VCEMEVFQLHPVESLVCGEKTRFKTFKEIVTNTYQIISEDFHLTSSVDMLTFFREIGISKEVAKLSTQQIKHYRLLTVTGVEQLR